jgi:hypothetical protein
MNYKIYYTHVWGNSLVRVNVYKIEEKEVCNTMLVTPDLRDILKLGFETVMLVEEID